MGMNADGGTGKAVSEINVTPLIDVLLVLLIIFMVIVPVTSKGLSSQIPQPAKNDRANPPQTIVVQVKANGVEEPTYLINQTAFPKSQIESRPGSHFCYAPGKGDVCEG